MEEKRKKMKHAKRLLSVVLALAMLLAMSACAAEPEPQEEQEPAGTPVVETPEEDAAEEGAQAPKDETVDAVIVGGGGAGMTTAIRLVEGGKNVVLVEKQGILGGATNLAATYFVAVNTPVQQEAGMGMAIEDYVASQVEANPLTSAENLTTLLERSEDSRQWLLGLGVDLTRPMSYYQVGISDGSSLGVAIVTALTAEVDRVGVDYRVNTRATEIVMEDGKAAGVKVEGPDGAYTIYAKDVVLAAGGFAASPEMVAKYAPEWEGAASTTAAGNTGDAFVMAEAVGASLKDMDNVRMNPGVYVDERGGAYSLSVARAEGGIMVNMNGERFCNDYASDYTVMSRQIMEQEGDHVYIVFDQASVDRSERLASFGERGYFLQADTLEELAELMGVPAENLTATVERYRGFVDTGVDEDFGRTTAMTSRIDQAPYYAVPCIPGIQVTLGGIEVNGNMQVLDTQGAVIDGLYAVGECANDGLYGGAPTNINVTFGTLLAEYILENR